MSLTDYQHPSKKSLVIGGKDNGDRLSNLHESILSNILSRLPTKDRFRTCVLSKNWKLKWRCTDHMELIDYNVRSIYNHSYRDISSYSGSDKAAFCEFVDMLVLFAHNLKSFSLTCNLPYDAYRVKTWIYKMCRHSNIEKLKVVCSYFENKGLDLPWSLLDKDSLKDLILKLPGFTLNVTTQNYALNLTSFHLYRINVLNKNSSCDTLMLSFPVLEIFGVERCQWVNVEWVKIDAPVLHTYISETTYGPNNYSIEIASSKLLTYKSSGDVPDNITFTGSQITSVSFTNRCAIHLFMDVGIRIKKLLGESASLNELELSSFSVGALLSLRHPLHQHYMLKRLILSYATSLSGTKQLFELLQAMPLLEFLSVDLNSNVVTKCTELELVPVPICIISHLQELELLGFGGTSPQYFLVRILLKYCQVLKKVSCYGHSIRSYKDVLDGFRSFQRYSSSLNFVILKPNAPLRHGHRLFDPKSICRQHFIEWLVIKF